MWFISGPCCLHVLPHWPAGRFRGSRKSSRESGSEFMDENGENDCVMGEKFWKLRWHCISCDYSKPRVSGFAYFSECLSRFPKEFSSSNYVCLFATSESRRHSERVGSVREGRKAAGETDRQQQLAFSGRTGTEKRWRLRNFRKEFSSTIVFLIPHRDAR